MHAAGPLCIAAVAPRWAAVGGTALRALCNHVHPVRHEGRKPLPQSCLCALHTDRALLADDLSDLPLLFNPSQDHCCIDLYIDCRAAFIADMSLERQKSVFYFYFISFNEAAKLSPYLYRAWHVLREKHLPVVPFVGRMFKTDLQDPEEIFWLFRKLSLRDYCPKEYKYCYHIGTEKTEFSYVSFNLSERKQSSV